MRLVDAVLLADPQCCQARVTVGIEQCDLLPDGDRSGRRGVGGQRDRYRPEQAAGQLHALAHAAPVVMRHEALERREAADAEHDEIASLAGGHHDLLQLLGLLQFLLLRFSLEEKDLQLF